MWKLVCGRACGLRRQRDRRGQSILEYVVIATVIVLAIFAIKGTVQTNLNGVYGNAANKTADAGTSISGLAVENAM